MDSAYLTGMEPVTCVIALTDTVGITVKVEVSFILLGSSLNIGLQKRGYVSLSYVFL